MSEQKNLEIIKCFCDFTMKVSHNSINQTLCHYIVGVEDSLLLRGPGLIQGMYFFQEV